MVASNNKVTISFEANSTKAIAAVEKLVSKLNDLPATISKLNSSVSSLNQKITTMTSKIDAAGAKAAASSSNLKTLNKDITSLGTRTGTASAKVEAMGKNVSLLSRLTSGFNKAASSANNYATAANRAATARAPSSVSAAPAINPFGTANTIMQSGQAAIGTVSEKLTGSLAKLGGYATSASKLFLGLNDSVRLVAQGVTNLGRAMFFFISIPIFGFLMKAGRAAVDFEDAMVRVQKTTNLPTFSKTGNDIKTLTANIRELAKYTASSHVELAGIAEVIGQVGVTDVGAITNLTQIFEMMSQTVGMTGETVALEMSQIAIAFGWNLNSASDDVFALANVINYLENTTAASASNIITSMAKWAQAAKQLNVSAADAAALSASLVSMGLSEEEAGTALKRMSSQLIRNSDRVAQAMGANKKYADQQAVLTAINEDAIGVWLDLATAAEAAGEGGQRAEALFTLINAADERGGRGLMAMANNIDMIRRNMSLANQEWSRHTSLVNEYNRAMTSTKNSMAALRNNVNDVAITIGDALLPVINKIIVMLIPALQSFSKWFSVLDSKTKLMYVGFVLAALAAGPVLMLLGQIAHGFNLIFMGAGLFVKVIPQLVSALIPLINGVAWLARAFISWPAAIALAVVGVLKILSKMGVDVAGFFMKISSTASAWGEKLMSTYANGLALGAQYVLKVISWIAELIAGFFRAKSPPKEGPLSTIDKWGTKLLQTYLKGFKDADFGILTDIGKMIESQLTRGKEGDSLNEALGKYAKARVILSKMLANYNKTGLLDEGLLNEALDGVGVMKEDLGILVKLQLKYLKIQEALLALEERRKGVLRTYQGEIAAVGASNASIEDKVANIRKSMRTRDGELRIINKEEEALKAQEEAAKTQYEFQKKMVDAMMEQESIIEKLLDAVDKLGRKIGGMGDALEDFQFPDMSGAGGMDDIEAKLEEASEKVKSFVQRVQEGRQMLSGLSAGFSGGQAAPRQAFSSDEAYSYYLTMYNIGQRAKDIKEKFDKVVEVATTWWNRLKGIYDEIKKIDLSKLFDFSNVKITLPKMEDLTKMPVIGDIIAGFSAGFDPATGDRISKAFEDIGKNFQNLLDLLSSPDGQKALSTVGTILIAVAKGVGWIVGFAVGALGTLIGWFLKLGAFVQGIYIKILAFWLGLSGAIRTGSSFIGRWLGAIIELFGGLVKPLVDAWPQISEALGGLREAMMSVWTALLNVWTALQPVTSFLGGVLLGVLTAVGAVFGAVFAAIAGIVYGAIKGIITALSLVIPFFVGILTGLYNIIAGAINVIAGILQVIINTVIAIFTGDWQPVFDGLNKLWQGIVQIFTGLWQAVSGIFMVALGAIIGLIGGFVEGVIAFFTNLWYVLVGGSIIPDMLNAILTWFTNILNQVKTFVSNILTSIVNLFTTKFAAAKKAVIDTLSGVASKIREYITEVKNAGIALIQGFIDGINSMFSNVLGAVTKVISGAVRLIKNLLGIKSPSKVFELIGKYTVQGFIEGVDSEAMENAGIYASLVPPKSAFASDDTSFGSVGGTSIVLNFGRDSVRSEDDINKIAAAVERVITKKTRSKLGYNFGG